MVDRFVKAVDVDARRRKRVTFAWVCGVALVAVVVAFQSILRPFVLGALLAYVLHPVVAWVCRARVGPRQLPRWGAVVLIYVGLVTTLVLAVTAITPRVVREVRDFAVHEVPEIRHRAHRSWLPAIQGAAHRMQSALGDVPQGERPPRPREAADEGDDNAVAPAPPDGVMQKLRTLGAGHVVDIVRVGGGIIGGVIGGIFGFFMTMMVSAYMLVTEAQIFAFARSLVSPGARRGFDALLDRLDRGLKGVVRGQLIICMVNGALSLVGFSLAGLKYGPTLALVATVFSLVPIFGSIMSSIPAVAIGLTQSFGTGLFVLLWILGIHQLEANLLNPKIMGDAAKIHPVLVVFSLLAGEHFFGILGALLAVPAMSIVQSVFLHWRAYALDWGDEARDPPIGE